MSERRSYGLDHPNLVPAALLPPEDPAGLGPSRRTGRDWFVDIVFFMLAGLFGVVIYFSILGSAVGSVSVPAMTVDLIGGLVACVLLWWRRRWPVGVAVVNILISAVSGFATVAAILALFSLAVHRRSRVVFAMAGLAFACAFVFAVVRPQKEHLWLSMLISLLLVAGVVAWGMFVRARRQLVWSLRERAERAEADQRQQADQARAAERTRIAREMHDVLAHRISLVALHAGALELNPDLPPERVRETAELLRTTARQALEELRGVIGVLRDESGEAAPAAPQPTLADIPRLVEETRRAGAKIDFEMPADPAIVPAGLGRDAYRIVQEALTNVGKHARGTSTEVRVSGSPGAGLTVSVRNRLPAHAELGPPLPGAGAGLLGLQERVALAGGTLVHGPDGTGDFVVEANLQWR